MLFYALRRLAFALPTLLVISLAVFALMALAPGDPMAQLPLTIPAEVRAEMRSALGLDAPFHVRYGLWLWQLVVVEPRVALEALLGLEGTDAPRILSWQTRAPVFQLIAQRLPQTLTVVGLAYLLGIAVALPLGIWSAYRQNSTFDRAGNAIALLGVAVPPFFSGAVLIYVFSIRLEWLPSIYDTTLSVTDWNSLWEQARQMLLPVAVLSLQTTAQITRYMRAAMLDALGQDYVRAARAKGLSERAVLMGQAARTSLIPVVSVIALGAPQVFAGAIITEQIFGVNGVGQLLISSIRASDLPTVQTITMLLAALIILANLLADLAYGLLDPRVRYD
ncbi:ABC transporter permease [Rhodobacteraceae bacterium KMM 6894]|nr:ABC transporter permease [Rhodobacteraceae bacterium KMM 6894]